MNWLLLRFSPTTSAVLISSTTMRSRIESREIVTCIQLKAASARRTSTHKLSGSHTELRIAARKWLRHSRV
eukprot:1494915-Rhodomonas_salina.2